MMSTTPRRAEIESMYYLSHLQEGLLFHHVAEEGVDPYVDQAVYHLEGTIDVPAFEQAWQAVVQHHAVLRTAFVWEQVPRPIQVVQKTVRLSIEYADWQSCGQAAQAADLRATMEADRRQGFEFRRAPLLRLRLIRTGPRDYALLYTHHHILLDGWSFQLMVRDLLDCYGALIQREKPKLDPVRPYRDYIAWLQRQDLKEAEHFWRTYLTGFTAPTRFPTGEAPLTSEPRMLPFAEQTVVLPPADSERIRVFIRQQRLTLNTMIQGAWALLLHRYDQETDVVFGTTVSGRPPDLDGADTMVGLFINTLPVRVRIGDDAQVSSWLKLLQKRNSVLRHYEYTPLAKIQGWSDVPSGRSLFETIVVFENFPIREQAGLALHDLHIRTRPMGDARDGYWLTKGRNNYPISLVVEPGADIQITLCYAHERFSHAMMTRWLAQFRKIMEWMITHPHGRLSDLTFLTSEERRRMLVDWNPPASMSAESRCVHELFEAIAGRKPDRLALVFEEQRLTYGELNRRANRLAHRLRAAGVGPGVRVGICLERSPELVIAIWGVLKAGAAYVPVEPSMPPERLVFVLRDADVAVLLAQTAVRATFSADAVAVLQTIRIWDIEDVIHGEGQGGADTNLSPPNPQCSAYVIYTSGSTGQPKGVAVSHRALVSYLTGVLAAMAVPETATEWALISTVAADLGHTMLFGALCAGRTLHLLSTDRGFHPEQMAAYMQREQIHVLKITPSHLAGLLDATHPEQVLPYECLVLGGEALTWPLVERVHALAPTCTVINHYGPTETTVGVLTHRVDGQEPRRGATVPLGRPLAHSRAYILDRRLELAPAGLTGELYLGGTGLAHGYHQQPGLTADRFMPDPFSQAGTRMYRTGDQARYREDGSIEFLGRRDHQIKLRGYRIELGEIEAHLRAYPEVQEAVVVLRDGAAGAKQLAAYVVPTSGAAGQLADLRSRLVRQLPDYMVPQAIIELTALPLTPNGKLDRAALPDPDQSRDQRAEMDAAPQTDVEQRLAEIWKEVLRRDRIGRHDNFFELGGDSILSLQIIARAHRSGLKLTPKQLFERPTIAGLAEVAVVRALNGQMSQGPVTGTVPLTPIQQWFFEARHPNLHHWNQAVLLKMQKPLELPLLVQAMQILVEHHDALRLRFQQDPSGQWTQAYAPAETHPLCRRIDLREVMHGQSLSWAQVLETLATEVQQNLNITQGPLLQAVYFDRGPEEPGRLLLVVHHLVVDGVSWRVLVEDLQTVYRQLARKQPVELPAKTTSWKTWSERLRMYPGTDAVAQERTYWLAEGRKRTVLLSDASARAGRAGDAATERVRLSLEETRALLHDVPSVYRTEINDILLAALAQTLCRWSGRPSVDVELEGHGREDLFDGVDISRTVGWFTTRFPVTLTPGTGKPGEAIQAIKAQLRRIPKKGIGYGVLRYLSQDAVLRHALTNELPTAVCFNYLGQLDVALEGESLFTLAHESVGPSRDPQSRRREVLDVNVQIVEHQLSIDWRYPSSDRDAVAMRGLADRYVEALRELITHCLSPGAGGVMASDFEAAGLTDEELHDLLKEMG
jgi:amino acid adenylation domain-containing protein/non-ribosomal peptide synthase protein (TIGR01720 family)